MLPPPHNQMKGTNKYLAKFSGTLIRHFHNNDIVNFVFFQFSSLFPPTDVRKCEIRNQGAHENCISRLHILLVDYWLIFNSMVKMKLVMLAICTMESS